MEMTRCGSCGADADSAPLLLGGSDVGALCATCLLRAHEDRAGRSTADAARLERIALAIAGDPQRLVHAEPAPPDPYPAGAPPGTPAEIGEAIATHAAHTDGLNPLLLGELFRYLGDALVRRRREEHARLAYDRAHALLARYDGFRGDPRSDEARGRRALGAVFIQLGQVDASLSEDLHRRAIDIFAEYIEVEARAARNFCIAHHNLAAARWRKGDPDAAAALVERALPIARAQIARHQDANLEDDVFALEGLLVRALRAAKRWDDAIHLALEISERREQAGKDATSLRAERRTAFRERAEAASLPRPRFCSACDAANADVDVLVEGLGGALCDRCLRRAFVKPAADGESRDLPCSFCSEARPTGGIVVDGVSKANACARCTDRLREHLVRHAARAAAVVWISPDVTRVDCSFCDTPLREAKRMFNGVAGNICDECLASAAGELVPAVLERSGPWNLPGRFCSFCGALGGRALIEKEKVGICDRCIGKYQEP